MAKTVQISADLFDDLCSYFIDGEDDAAEDIIAGLNAKIEKLKARELYSAAYAADTPAERETARQAYLDHKGIPAGYRWDEGCSPDAELKKMGL